MSGDLTDLERELASRLEAAAGSPGRAATERLHAALEVTSQRRGPIAWLRVNAPRIAWRQAAAMVTVAVVALLVGIGLGSSGLLVASRPTGTPAPSGQPSAQPSATLTPEASPTPQPSPTPLPSPPVSIAYTTWTQLAMPDPTPHVWGGEWATSMVAFKDAYYAFGFINGGCCTASYTTDTRAVVWRSADGVTWALEPNQPAFAIGHMTAAASDGSRLVVVGDRSENSAQYPGEAEPHLAAWTSTDGRTWQVAANITQSLGRFTSVTAMSGGGFLAASSPYLDQSGPTLWESSDGLTWSVLASPAHLGTGEINAVRATSLGVFAVGDSPGSLRADGSTGPNVPAVWRLTSDGAWVRMRSEGLAEGQIADLAEHHGVLVAIGTDGTSEHGAAWWSSDGRTWTPAGAAAFAGDKNFPTVVVATPSGFVALGTIGRMAGDQAEPSLFRAWSSPDGVTWSVVPDPAVATSADRAGGALVLAGGRVVVVGTAGPEPSQRDGQMLIPVALTLDPARP